MYFREYPIVLNGECRECERLHPSGFVEQKEKKRIEYKSNKRNFRLLVVKNEIVLRKKRVECDAAREEYLKGVADEFWRGARASIRLFWRKWRMFSLAGFVVVVVATRRRHSAGPVGGNRSATSSRRTGKQNGKPNKILRDKNGNSPQSIV